MVNIDNMLDKMDNYMNNIRTELYKKDYEKMNNHLEIFNDMLNQLFAFNMTAKQQIRFECGVNNYYTLLGACIEQSKIDRKNCIDETNYF